MPTYKKEKEQTLIVFSGTQDTAACIDFEAELYAQIAGGSRSVVFDLEEVDMISSMFLRICIKVLRHTGERGLTVLNPSPAIMKVFKMTRFTALLNIPQFPEQELPG